MYTQTRRNMLTNRQKSLVIALLVSIFTYGLYETSHRLPGTIVDEATRLQQDVVCQANTQQTASTGETGQVFDRFNNRMACDLCQPDDVFCLSIG